MQNNKMIRQSTENLIFERPTNEYETGNEKETHDESYRGVLRRQRAVPMEDDCHGGRLPPFSH